MKYFKLLIPLFFVLISCNQQVKKPKNLISQENMVEILTDIYLHQQPAYAQLAMDGNLNYAEIDAQIIKKHNSTIELFKESFEYYVLTPELYTEILLKVRENLENKLPEEEREKIREEREKREVQK